MEDKLKEQIETMKRFQVAFKDDAKLFDIYEDVIKTGREILTEQGTLGNVCLIIMRDHKDNKYRVMVYPMFKNQDSDMDVHAQILKHIINDLQTKGAEKHPHIKMVGVIRFGTGVMQLFEKDVINKDGSVNEDRLQQLQEEVPGTDVMLFELEEDFIKTTRMYEYITSDDGSVVVNEKPVIDEKSTYDEREAKLSALSYLFTRGQSAVN